MNSNDSTPEQAPAPSRVTLVVITGQHIPSKKNRHYALTNGSVGIDKDVKSRMHSLEHAIELALCSWCQTTGSGTPLECLKQLRTLLSGLSDDSIREIPCGNWDVRRVPKGQEGIEVTIEKI